MLSTVQWWSFVPRAEILTVVFGSAANTASPASTGPGVRVAFDGHAGVVEHERDVPVVGGQRGRLPELPGEDLQIEGEPELAQGRESRQPRRVGHEVAPVAVGEHGIGVPVQDVADAADGDQRGVRLQLLVRGR